MIEILKRGYTYPKVSPAKHLAMADYASDVKRQLLVNAFDRLPSADNQRERPTGSYCCSSSNVSRISEVPRRYACRASRVDGEQVSTYGCASWAEATCFSNVCDLLHVRRAKLED